MSKYLFFFFSLNLMAQSHLDIDQIFKAQQERFEKFDQKMEELFKNFDKEHRSIFDDSKKFNKKDFFSNIEKIEDSNKIKLIISASDLKNSKINIELKNGVIHLTGKTEKKKKNQGGWESYSASQFSQSFPIPEGGDENSLETKIKNDKISLIFKKLTNNQKHGKKRKVRVFGGINV